MDEMIVDEIRVCRWKGGRRAPNSVGVIKSAGLDSWIAYDQNIGPDRGGLFSGILGQSEFEALKNAKEIICHGAWTAYWNDMTVLSGLSGETEFEVLKTAKEQILALGGDDYLLRLKDRHDTHIKSITEYLSTPNRSATTNHKMPSDTETDQHSKRIPTSLITLNRCILAGIWGAFVLNIGIKWSRNDMAWTFCGFPMLGLPWLLFDLNDSAKNDKTINGTEAAVRLVVYSLGNIICIFPFLVLYSILRGK